MDKQTFAELASIEYRLGQITNGMRRQDQLKHILLLAELDLIRFDIRLILSRSPRWSHLRMDTQKVE